MAISLRIGIGYKKIHHRKTHSLINIIKWLSYCLFKAFDSATFYMLVFCVTYDFAKRVTTQAETVIYSSSEFSCLGLFLMIL